MRLSSRVDSSKPDAGVSAYRTDLAPAVGRREDAGMPDDDSYPTHGWGALAADPWMPIGADGPEYREILRRIWLRQGGTNEVFESLMPAKPASDGTTYPPEAIRVLEGMTPPLRPAGFVEDASDVQES